MDSQNTRISRLIKGIKKHPIALVLVMLATILAGVTTFVTNLASLGKLVSKEETVYTATVEVAPIHILYGAVESAKFIVSDPEEPKSMAEISKWVARIVSKEAESRGFGNKIPEKYVLEINGSSLSLSGKSIGKFAYLYALLPYDIGQHGAETFFQGIKNDRPPSLGQRARTLHKISMQPSDSIDLDRYFSFLSGFVQEDCSCILLTFHGSNGQFKGELVTVYSKGGRVVGNIKKAGRAGNTYTFRDGKTEKEIVTNPRQARALFIVPNQLPYSDKFRLLLRKDIQNTLNISLSPKINSKEELTDYINKIQNMPIGEAREQIIDQYAVDFLVEVVLSEEKRKKLFGIWSM